MSTYVVVDLNRDQDQDQDHCETRYFVTSALILIMNASLITDQYILNRRPVTWASTAGRRSPDLGLEPVTDCH